MTVALPLGTMYALLLVLARVGGLVVFLPVPGFRNAPDTVRVALAAALTLALFPVWPALPNANPSMGTLTAWALREAGFGLMAGLAVAFLTEAFQIAAHILRLQAGYGYAQTIDPNSQADSSVLQVFLSLMTGLLFFTLGIDHGLIRILAVSFERFPAGSFPGLGAPGHGAIPIDGGGAMLSTGLRVALPVTALLLLIDVALALMGRMQQQLQLLSMAFPVKMIAALMVLIALAPLIPKLFAASAERTLEELWRAIRY